MPALAQAEDYFNPGALEVEPGQQQVDLERFAVKGGQMPGTYRVDLYLNDVRLDTRDIPFVDAGQGKLQPQFTVQQLKDMGVKIDAFPALQQLPASQPVDDLGAYIRDAGTRFNSGVQRLDISISQAALTSEARGYVDPSEWDQGLTAGLLNYTFTGSNTSRDRGAHDDSYYLNLRSGLNLGAWRLRNYSTLSQNKGRQAWQNISTYAQRDVHSLKSQLTLGDAATPSDVFDSVQFRGAQLASDDSMVPDSLRGFAPVVRGIAQSNAQVTIRQNGYIIYQTYVPPGAFAISDLYPTSSSGDLAVTITEADGSERRFVQPFSSVPVMVREGRFKYSATAGQYRSYGNKGSKPGFVQSTLIYGLPANYTLYGGAQASEKYTAAALGLGHSFGDWGSISMDVTQANTEFFNGAESTGQSYRFRYAKDIAATGTTFTLAGYRYSTSGFYTFQEASQINDQGRNTAVAALDFNNLGGTNATFVDPNFKAWRSGLNARSRAEVSISQALNGYGNFNISAYQQDYWGSSQSQRSVSTSYNTNYKGVNYSAAYTYSQTPVARGIDQQVSFSVQVPFDVIMPNSWASYSVNASKRGNTTQTVGVSGTALPDNNLNYNVQQSYVSQGSGGGGNSGGNGSANLGYKGTYGEAKVGYVYDRNSQQLNYGLAGGIVATEYGVAFSQQQSETLALVRAPGASGVKVQNQTGVYTDWRGYAVVPYVTTYRQNRIGLDSETLADDVDIEGNTKTVTPTQGAVVLADFQTRVGSRVLMTLRHLGKPVKFGATATVVEEGAVKPNSAIVGMDGQVYLSGVPDAGRLRVSWGEQASDVCIANFALPRIDASSSVRMVELVCE
ncbi:fimbrial biogenesis outer membrane usher protein [Pseudomonas tolaasii]|nr:fimbrial biogenesis outer membrane usher protein [Pseudomonas tolaasii]